MCRSCWGEYGCPKIKSDRTRKAAKLIAEVYEYSVMGGNLHSIIDDWNIEDDSFTNEEMKVYHKDAPIEQLEVERRTYKFLRKLSLEERASALAIEEGYISAN